MNYSSMQYYQGIPPTHERIAGGSSPGTGHRPIHGPQTMPGEPLQQKNIQLDGSMNEPMVEDFATNPVSHSGPVQMQDWSSSTEQQDEDRLLGQGQSSSQTDRQGSFDPHAVWQMLLSELALQMPSATFNTWVRDTWVVAYEDGEFIIGLPNAYARDWLENRLRNKIKRALSSFIFRSVQVQFLVCPRTVGDPKDANSTPLYAAVTQGSVSGRQPAVAEPLIETAYADKRTNENSRKSTVETSAAVDAGAQAYSSDAFNTQNPGERSPYRDTVAGSAMDTYPHAERDHNISARLDAVRETGAGNRYFNDGPPIGTIPLNGQYTFETFVVGSHNKLAHAAAEAIAEKPGQSFNPLFVYGGVGLGKTHLLHSIGHRAKQLGHRMLYVSSEQFTNELIGAIRSQSTEEFRNKYRQVDILLIDDIQFISGKESTQEEFFHTFNHLHASGRQVVLTSDRPPKMLATLDDRLRSRFEGGLQTDIAQPDFETRVAILQSKANRMAAHVDHSVLMMVAERVDSNIRELEGALNRLIVQARLMQSPLTLQLATTILGNLSPERSACAPNTLVRIVAEHFHLTEADLCGRKRTKEIAGARQVAMYLLREEHGLSLPAIGSLLGGRDHSTVRYGIEKIDNDLTEDETLRQTVAALREKIYLPL